MKYFGGIDPGKKGAIVVMDQTGRLRFGVPMPIKSVLHPHSKAKNKYKDELDIHRINEIFKKINNRFPNTQFFLEKQQAMSKGNIPQGAVTNFSTGKSYGYLEALLIANNFDPVIKVGKVWQNFLYKNLHLQDMEAKERALFFARRLYPSQSFLATKRSRKPHEGIIDAVLMAEYMKQTFLK